MLHLGFRSIFHQNHNFNLQKVATWLNIVRIEKPKQLWNQEIVLITLAPCMYLFVDKVWDKNHPTLVLNPLLGKSQPLVNHQFTERYLWTNYTILKSFWILDVLKKVNFNRKKILYKFYPVGSPAFQRLFWNIMS